MNRINGLHEFNESNGSQSNTWQMYSSVHKYRYKRQNISFSQWEAFSQFTAPKYL